MAGVGEPGIVLVVLVRYGAAVAVSRWQRQAARPRTGLGTVALPKRGMDDGMERDGWGFLLKSAAHVRVVGA